ncbi:MAG: murein L,D-transpeptidase [Desulfobacteraceae bacterium]
MPKKYWKGYNEYRLPHRLVRRPASAGKDRPRQRYGPILSEMKRSVSWQVGLLLVLALAALFSESHAERFPSSRRLRKAVRRQRPLLERSMIEKGFDWGSPIYLRIFKAEKQLELWLKREGRFHIFKSYPVCSYGGKGVGPKTRQGDGRAPEGFYFVSSRQMNPGSRYHLAFNLGYPNDYDRCHGRTGSALMVHGRCVSIGCFAMTDEAMEELYVLADAALDRGQPFFRVHIFPFRMTERNMQSHRSSPWYGFWSNLKTGYDWFSAHGNRPPDATVLRGRYAFAAASSVSDP